MKNKIVKSLASLDNTVLVTEIQDDSEVIGSSCTEKGGNQLVVPLLGSHCQVS